MHRFENFDAYLLACAVAEGARVLSGEVHTNAYVDVQKTAREVIKNIGYTKAEYMFDCGSCGVISSIHEQSPDINQGVVRKSEEEQGAGDQGMMFGYASRETDTYMPLSLTLSHELLRELSSIRREGVVMTYLRPDAKSQVTIEYDDNNQPLRVHTIVVSTQHDDFDNDEHAPPTPIQRFERSAAGALSLAVRAEQVDAERELVAGVRHRRRIVRAAECVAGHRDRRADREDSGLKAICF